MTIFNRRRMTKAAKIIERYRLLIRVYRAELIGLIVQENRHRCINARDQGGIALEDVVEGKAVVPEGWILDGATDYFLPPGARL